ncbi:MAG: hypothetical protein WAW36_09180 [Methylovulum miyakonense]|uniref:hypothetical protein n=1 Tax=Methylovulum miyakonense TaxID=645578 RepID=UPI003BB78D6E
MIHRSIPVLVCLLLIVMPGIDGLQTQHASFIRQQTQMGTGRGGSPGVAPPLGWQKRNPAHNAAPTPVKGGQQPSAMQRWQALETRLFQSEFQQIPIMAALLAEDLRLYPDPDIYQNINGLLMQPELSLAIKAILLDFLSETATPEALSQLLDLAKQELQSSLYILVLQAISRIGDNRWHGQFHEELSPALETAWTDPEATDPALLAALGKAIAVVGAPEGVGQLLLTVSGSTKNTEPEATNRIKQEVAFKAVPQVRNPAAVKVLGASLRQEPVGAPAFEASGNALAAMSSVAATQQIADWAKDAPPEGARNLEGWLGKIDDEQALAPISAAQNQSTQSPEIKMVIHKAAANRDNLNGALSAASVIEKN